MDRAIFKTLAMCMIAIGLFSGVSCRYEKPTTDGSTGKDTTSTHTNPTNPTTPVDTTGTGGSPVDTTVHRSGVKTLIVYFSRAGENYSVGFVNVGNTAMMSGYIQELIKADVFVIEPVTPYTTKYDEMLAKAQAETASNARPAIKDTLRNLSQYDTIIIGSPIWHGNPPMIMHTFYDKYDLSNKVIIPFGTHEGSGIGTSTTLLKSYFPNATILESLGIRGSDVRNNVDDSKKAVRDWLKRVKLLK
jgi:flavodoxin